MTIVSRALATVILLALPPAIWVATAITATHHYVVANNNTFPTNSVSLYEVSGASLVPVATVPTGGTGSEGGYFAGETQSVALDGTNVCVFAGDASSIDISAMKAVAGRPYLEVVGNYVSPDGDADTNAGLGIITLRRIPLRELHRRPRLQRRYCQPGPRSVEDWIRLHAEVRGAPC